MTAAGTSPSLLLLPSLKAVRGPRGRLRLTQKYLDGAAEFAKSWPGPVTSLVEIDEGPSTEMDLVDIDPAEVEPGIALRPADPREMRARLTSAAIALAHLSPGEAKAAALCAEVGTPICFTSEYTPRTEAQIIDANTRNPALRLRRKHWLRGAERTRVRMLRETASGLQCSGTPTWNHYRPIVPEALLFFDNRVRAADVISDADLDARAARLREGRPLALVFGGRLVAMKGVMDLPRVARALDARGTPYTLDIVGSGPLENRLRKEIAALGHGRVTLRPPMDFRSGWVPFLRREADLFLCCHPQGDPSSTYPEVMSCGVPIVGYDNEAWSGVADASDAGWRVPIHDHGAMAGRVAALHRDRDAIARSARRGRDFAMEHCFENSSARRVAHLVSCL